QHASASFDLAVFDYFCSALAAATLVSVPEWMFGQVGKTCRWIVQNGITVWYSVPSALLAPTASATEVLSDSQLRHVVFAGETIRKESLQTFAKYLPSGCALSNWYGPTETNVCTYKDIGAEDLASDAPVPIGIPCPYAEIEIAPTPQAAEKGQPPMGE